MLALGLDLGTTGVRVVAVDAQGALLAEVTHSYPLYTPQPGWTEQHPEDWAAASLAALREIALGLEGHEIIAIGLSGQMHGMVALDASGQPIRPAILWNDQRTGLAVAEIEAAIPRRELLSRTGNPAITGFHLPKLLWLRQAEPEAYARTRHSLLPKDYLGYVLTGIMAAEPTDASGTNCFNLTRKAWDKDVLRAVGVDPALFPEIIPSHGVTGLLTAEAAAATGLPEGLPVVAGAGDNAAAATGLGLSSRQLAIGSVSLGTSGVIFAPLQQPTPDPEGRVHLFCHADGGYHLLGVTLAAAGSLQWYRDTLAPGQSFTELMGLAAQSPPGANGVTFKPYLAGERTPHLDPKLRGSFSGLSLATTQADLVRAVIEGVAFSLRDALDVIGSLTTLSRALATGGGAKSDLWLQLVADVLELPLSRPAQNQGAAYGAALLALQGAGVVSDATTVANQATIANFRPQQSGAYREPLQRYRTAG
ncbi:MAG: xylulokinase [Truepera sp.]|nr:xylulokinase [Truepera sp.]